MISSETFCWPLDEQYNITGECGGQHFKGGVRMDDEKLEAWLFGSLDDVIDMSEEVNNGQ